MNRVPDFPAAAEQFFTHLTFCILLQVLFQRRAGSQGIQKVPIEADAGLVIDKAGIFLLHDFSVFPNQPKQMLQQIAVQQNRPCVQVHRTLAVHCPHAVQLLCPLLVEEIPHISFRITQKNTVILSDSHIFLDGDGRCPFESHVYLQRIKQQQYIPRQYQHSLF